MKKIISLNALSIQWCYKHCIMFRKIAYPNLANKREINKGQVILWWPWKVFHFSRNIYFKSSNPQFGFHLKDKWAVFKLFLYTLNLNLEKLILLNMINVQFMHYFLRNMHFTSNPFIINRQQLNYIFSEFLSVSNS